MESCIAEVYYITMVQKGSKLLFSNQRISASYQRAARIAKSDADFLVSAAAKILGERLNAITREFEVVADLYSPFSGMEVELQELATAKSIVFLRQDAWNETPSLENSQKNVVVGQFPDIPFQPSSINLATSLFALHRSNNLPNTLMEIREALRPDGLFMAVLPGSQTLTELRQSLIQAESELSASVSLRIDPFGEIRQYGALLQAAGYALPVVDTETFTVRYSSLASLVNDIRAMGAGSALNDVPAYPHRNLFKRTEEILLRDHADQDGKFRITVELVFLSGWKPHESQQKPMKPGAALNKLKDFL